MKITIHEIRYHQEMKVFLHNFRKVERAIDIFNGEEGRWVTSNQAPIELRKVFGDGHDLFLEIFKKENSDLTITVWGNDEEKPLVRGIRETIWDKSIRCLIDVIAGFFPEDSDTVIQAIRLVGTVMEHG